MKHGKGGVKLWKQVELKVVFQRDLGIPDRKQIVRAKPGRAWDAENIDTMLADAAENLEKQYPQFDFNLIERAPNAFTFAGRVGAAQ